MRKIGVFLFCYALLFLGNCSTTTSSRTLLDVNALFAQLTVDSAIQSLSFEEAIKYTAVGLGEKLHDKRIAVMKFESETPELSEYIMLELTGAFVRAGTVKTVDRQNIEAIQKELGFQASGMVSDKTAQSIGKMTGAQSLVFGSLVKTGENYRWRVIVVGIESAENEAAVIFNITADKPFIALVDALKKGTKKAGTSYREEEAGHIPQTAADFVNRGLVFFDREDYDTAILDFDAAIKADQKYAPGWFGRGRCYIYGKKDYNKAIADITQAIKLDPHTAIMYSYRAQAYASKAFLSGYPWDSKFFKDNINSAIADYTQHIRLDPDDLHAYRTRGMLYGDYKKDSARASADYKQAIRIRTQDIERNPGDSWAYSERGDYYRQIAYLDSNKKYAYENYEHALADYTAAIRLAPNYSYHYASRADVYQSIADLDPDKEHAYYNYIQALADCTAAIRLDPNNSFHYTSRASVYKSIRDREYYPFIIGNELRIDMLTANRHAIEDYTKAIELAPEDRFRYYDRGNAYEWQFDYEKAAADFAIWRKN